MLRTLLAICRWVCLIVMVVAGYWIVSYVVDIIVHSGNRKKTDFFIGNSTHAEPFHSKPEEWLKIEAVLPNCGLPKECPADHTAVSVLTFMSTSLNICVGGKMIMQKGVNNGGRGINIVVLDRETLKPIKARRFDTYDKESSSLEVFLQRSNETGDIFVLLSHDEASRNLSPVAKKLITQLGSGQIQNLGFRDQWFMVGQAGMDGLTPFEKLMDKTRASFSNLTESFCLPKKLPGLRIQPDPSLATNAEREEFCRTRPHLTYFCAGSVMRDPVSACAQAGSRALIGSPLLSSAILVMAGPDLPGLALTLETLAAQPGLKPRLVTVVYDPLLVPDAPQLCDLFSFVSHSAEGLRWPDALEVGLKAVVSSHSSSEYVLVLEEGLMLSPDFFAVMASLLPLLSDPNAMAVAGWNPNGYSGLNSRVDVVHRISDGPGLGFVVTWHTVTHHLLRNSKSCCYNRGWEGWDSWVAGGWVAVPEVSRVLMRPTAAHLSSLPGQSSVRQLFARLRRTSVSNNEILGAEDLRGERYLEVLSEILATASPLPSTAGEVVRCAQGHAQLLLPAPRNSSGIGNGAVYLPYKEGSDGSDGGHQWAGMVLLCRCFGLYDPGEGKDPKGVYRGLLRFSLDGREVMLVSNRSPLFEKIPPGSSPITLP